MPSAKKVRPMVKTALSRRIADYVNLHYDGNLSRAAMALGCNYDGLRNAALGTAKRVNLPVIQALAMRSGHSIEWWLA